MTSLVGLIGYPLGHTISPAFQQAAFDHYSLPAEYHAWPTHPDLLEAKVAALRGAEYLGANVTVPHKERAAGLVDRIGPQSEAIGAINTIVREDRILVGHNTDTYGFMQSLKVSGGFEPEGKRVLLIGAGGAARAAVFALADESIASLTIANRTLERAVSLANLVRDAIPEVSTVRLVDREIEETAARADLIVNSTSVGMRGGDAGTASPLPTRLIPPSALVFDMVYNAAVTPLLKAADTAGAQRLGGLPMLVYQGAGAFELWTGRDAPVEVMFKAAREALERLDHAS
ncbi:MAG: shikimate dehydrogenase [Chloroflexi bacterium]|nr:shikimate dehydrogenase [Chloroflexota bacterium]